MSTPFADEATHRDMEEKKQLLLQAVAEHCNENAEHEDLRKIGVALSKGSVLDAKVLSGGKSNYSYKIFVVDNEDMALFAKLTFRYALWNPDRSQEFSLERTQNEFDTMKLFADIMGENAPVAKPYLCLKVNDETRCLVTEWATVDEQFGNQFIDGIVDSRCIEICARAFAKVNLIQVDPDFNTKTSECVLSLMPQMKTIFAELTAQTEFEDDFIKMGREIGQQEFNRLMDNMHDDLNSNRQVLCHSDSHVFNILVEPKPAISELKQFGDKGTVAICDWELACCGPLGRDAGIFAGFPLACALCHAMQGHRVEAYALFDSVKDFWDIYAGVLVEEGGKNEAEMIEVFRCNLTWTAFFMTPIFYLLDIFTDVMPLDGLSEASVKSIKGIYAKVGLELMQYGCGGKEPDLDLQGLRNVFRSIVCEEIEILLSVRSKRSLPKRLSSLRASGRRLNDSFVFEEIGHRLSGLRRSGLPLTASLQTAGSISIVEGNEDED